MSIVVGTLGWCLRKISGMVASDGRSLIVRDLGLWLLLTSVEDLGGIGKHVKGNHDEGLGLS